jgi:hypothetical protein
MTTRDEMDALAASYKAQHVQMGLTKETAVDMDRVPAERLDDFNPDRFDAVPNGDGTFRLVPVLWWDDASYAAYQGDPHGDA